MDETIFQIIDNKPRITPEGLHIPELKKLWYNDKSKPKWMAQGELAYVYHMINPRSSYRNIPFEIREALIIEDSIPKSKQDTWKPNQWVKDALKKYEMMIETAAVRMLNSAEELADKYASYFKSINLEERDELGALVHDPVKVMNILNKTPDMIKALNDFRKEVQRGNDINKRKVRGGREFSSVFKEDE